MRTKKLSLFVATIIVSAVYATNNDNAAPERRECELPIELNGLYRLHGGHDAHVDQGDSRRPRAIVLDGDLVTVAGRPGFRGRTACSCTADHNDNGGASCRIARATPQDSHGGLPRPAAVIKDYEQFRLLPGHAVHLTFEMPLAGSVFPAPAVPRHYVDTVHGSECVHLYWLSKDRLSYWTTNVTVDLRCDPDDGSDDDYAEDRFRKNRTVDSTAGSRVQRSVHSTNGRRRKGDLSPMPHSTNGRRRKGDLSPMPPAPAIAYWRYDKLEPTSPPPSDLPGESDPVTWRAATTPRAHRQAEQCSVTI